MTPLDSSHFEVFLGNFLGIFYFFLIQIWILNLDQFDTGPNWNRAGPVWPVTGQTGPVPTDLVNHGPDAGIGGRRVELGAAAYFFGILTFFLNYLQ